MQAETRSRVNLKQLVYSSLDAIVEANTKMSQNTIDTIMKFSDNQGHDDDGYPVVQLKTLQLVYDQIKHDELDNICSEKIGLEVPILSIIALNTLKVSKSKIKFSTEVQEMENTDGEVNIYTKVTAAETERSALNPRIDFEIELESGPAPEGLSRIVDQLGQNFIPNTHEKYPVDSDGNKLRGDEAVHYDKQRKLKLCEQRINKLLAQLNAMQRIDENKDEDMKIFNELETYKTELETRLALVCKEIIETDINYELDREDQDEAEEKKTKTLERRNERKR